MYHADIGRGARPNSSAREAMSTSDADLGSEDHHCKTAGRLHLYRVWRHFSQATKQGLPSGGVKPLHAAQMAKIVTVPQEFRHSALHARSRRRRQGSSELSEPATQFRRHDHKTQAQRRADRFAETAYVQHPTSMIERCKSRSRPSFQLQFAQVIVLDDPGVVAPSPGEQCKPPRQRHRHAERRLLAWCHNCQFRSSGGLDTSGDIQSFRIDRDSCHSACRPGRARCE